MKISENILLSITLAAILAGCTNTTAKSKPTASEGLLSETELREVLTGETVYIKVPPGGPGGENGGMAVFKYRNDGTATASLPTGTVLKGRWRLENSSYCVDWMNGPKNSCSGLVSNATGYEIVDVKTLESRGEIERIEDGNPENL